MIELAKKIATEKHRGQFRRDGKTPYVSHPAAVAERLGNEAAEVVMAAWLHDVLEDTDTTVEELRDRGIPGVVLDAVVTLTKDESDYESYLRRVRRNEIACKVKVADMLHNLSDNPTKKQILKYSHGLIALLCDQDPEGK